MATTQTSSTIHTSSRRPSPSPLADMPTSPSSCSVVSLTHRSIVSGMLTSPDSWPDQGSEDQLVVHWPCPLLHPCTTRRGDKGKSRFRCYMDQRHSWFYLCWYCPQGLPRDPYPSAEEWSRSRTGSQVPPYALCRQQQCHLLCLLLPHCSSWRSSCDWRNGDGGFPGHSYALVPWEQRQDGNPSNKVYGVSNCHILRKNTTINYDKAAHP